MTVVASLMPSVSLSLSPTPRAPVLALRLASAPAMVTLLTLGSWVSMLRLGALAPPPLLPTPSV